MKTEKEIKDFFEKVEAIQNGHFILSSGKRSKIYCQCSKLFEDPRNGEMVCEELKYRVQENIDVEIDYVISPALGGLIYLFKFLYPNVILFKISLLGTPPYS